MSEQQAEQTSGEPGSLGAGPAAPTSSDAQSEPAAASMQERSAPMPMPARSNLPSSCPSRAPTAEAAKGGGCQGRGSQGRSAEPQAAQAEPDAPRAARQAHDHVARRSGLGNHDDAGPEPEAEPSSAHVRQAPDRRAGGRGGAGGGGRRARRRARDRGLHAFRRRRRRDQQTIARSKPRWRGSMPTSWR